MGAGSGKSTTGQTSSPFDQILAKYGKAALPVQQEMARQESEALRTGGVTNQIPIINRATDAGRQSASNSTELTRQALARAGLSNSSFAQSLLADQRMNQNENISQIPTNIAGQFISGAQGTVNAGIGADTAGANTYRNTISTPSFWEYFNQGLGNSAQGAGAGLGSYFGSFGSGSSASALPPSTTTASV